MNKLNGKGRFQLKLNVKYQLVDKDGNVKHIFTENTLGQFLLRQFRKIAPNAIDSDGKVRPGLFNHLAAFGLQIPGLTGGYGQNRLISNLVTTAGKALVAGRINGSGSPAAATYIAVGTGTTAANVADTTLETEISDSGLERANGSVSLVTTDTTNDTAQITNTFTVTGSKAVTESGVLNAASTGVLLARQVFSAINVVNGDSLQITWKLDVD